MAEITVNCTKFHSEHLRGLPFINLLLGAVLVVIGAISWATIAKLQASSTTLTSYYIALALVGVGTVTFLVATIGCYGVVTENFCIITALTVIMSILVVAQMILGTLAIAAPEKDEFNRQISKLLKSEFDNSNNVDVIQTMYRCCGYDGPIVDHDGMLPASCCPKPADTNAGTGCSAESPDHYDLVCKDVIPKKIKHQLHFLGILGVIISVTETLGVCFVIGVICAMTKY